ncbi:hypothetical protein RIF29_08672 [Crotalaria pallida]|uniref:STAS domain-containing protein n=1 Tax=Crotalaria pallida TaxID=3830 RepID=A0AAN9FTW4_CROPI
MSSTLEETLDLEKNKAEWVLNPPEPPCMLHQLLGTIKGNLLHGRTRKKISYLRNQPLHKLVITMLLGLFPILGSFRNYNVQKFKYDFMAGLTLASLSIPQSMGYATLAQLSPEYGLYSSIVPPLIYALLASSKEIVIGSITVDSLLLSSMIRKLKDPVHDSNGYTQLVLTATFLVGVFQVAFGLFRFGFLVDYLSDATIVGFLAAVAVGIGLQQLKGLFGIHKFTNKADLISVMKAVSSSLSHQSEWHPYNFVLGLLFLSFILFTQYLGRRNKKLFWLSSAAPLISVIVSSLIAYRVNVRHLKMEDYDVEVLGPIKGGSLNPWSFKQIHIDGDFVGPLIKTGLTVAVISTTMGISVARTFASLRGHNLDTNKEMVSLGLMNIVGSFCSCYVATGSLSRTAVNYNAGSETMVSSIVMALTVLMSLKFLTGLLYFTPKAVLAAIILSAISGLIDLKKAYYILKVDKIDFLACVGAFFGVLFASAEMGLVVGVTISFTKIILMSIQPGIAIVGKFPGSDEFGDIEQYPVAVEIPGLLILSIKSSWLCFANASLVRERIERRVTSEEVEDNKGESTFKFVILDISSLMSIDTAGIASLEELNKKLTSQGVKLAVAKPRWHVIHKLRLANFVEKIGGRVFLSVGEAAELCIIGAKMAAV